MKRIPVIMIASLFVIGIPAITQSDPVPKKNGNKYGTRILPTWRALFVPFGSLTAEQPKHT